MNRREYDKIAKRSTEANKAYLQQKGRLEELYRILKDKYDCESLEDAKKLLAKKRKQRAKMVSQMEQLEEELAAWEDRINED